MKKLAKNQQIKKKKDWNFFTIKQNKTKELKSA